MDAIPYSTAHANLADVMDRVCSDHAPTVITRADGKAVVMMALDDYNSLEETVYLMRSPKNARRLLDSMVALEDFRSR